MCEKLTSGRLGAGSDDGTWPNRLAMVSTGKSSAVATTVPTTRPIRAPGNALEVGQPGAVLDGGDGNQRQHTAQPLTAPMWRKVSSMFS